MSRIPIGVIGAGGRARSYLRHVPEALRPRVELAAIADPDPGQRAAYEEAVGFEAARHYERGADLLARESLAGLVVASPNHEHAADAVPAIERRIPTVLEKPVATTVDDAARLWRAYRAAGEPPVAVGFVLRYTPFFARLRELVAEGGVGQILSIDADEAIGPGLTRMFYRSPWRRWDRLSGGFLVEKCCHDMDLLHWLSGRRARRVFSIARRTHFVPDPPGGRLPAYEAERVAPREPDEPGRPYAGALYDEAGDLPDHQTTTIELEGGVLASFNACFAQPRGTRRMRVYGARGFVEGDIGRGELRHERVTDLTEPTAAAERHAIEHDESGHHGGDTGIVEAFWRAVAGEPAAVRAGLREGIEAVLLSLAAERSAATEEPVDVAAMRERVFGDAESPA